MKGNNMNLFSTLFSLISPHRPSQYLGPETLMPLASILAAIAGFFLIFWRLIARVVKTAYRKIRGLPDEVPPEVDVEEAIDDEQDK
jgi:hypothetical protein